VEQILLVFAAYVVVIASPGPSTMAIMGTAMAQGRRSAVALALGVVTGSMIWALLAATGISTLLAAYAEALVAIKIAGGLYLLYLSWKSARAALSVRPRRAATAPAIRAGALWRRGVLLHLTNPKAILGWIAIMSLGLGPDAPARTLAVFVAGCAVLGLTVNVGYALAFSTGVMTRAYAQARRWIEGTLAVLFAYAGVRLLLSRT
jgi:threonine/homoserine/homoserine lactone efflux protein